MIHEIFKESFSITSYQTDQSGKARVSALFNWMLEAAWAHAQVLDWGYDSLKENHMFWVLSRIRIDVNRLPKWQEEVHLETWSAGTDGMFAYREFIIRDANNEPILKCNSAWLVLNLETHKIITFKGQEEQFPYFHSDEICDKPKRLRFKPTTEPLNFSPVRFSEIDINQHFNSVNALSRVLDNYGIDFQKKHEIRKLEINYLKEGFGGDNLAVVHKEGGTLTQQSAIVREEDQNLLSLYEIEWQEIEAQK